MPEPKESAAGRSPFLSNDEAAAFLNLSPQTLNKYRVIGGGPLSANSGDESDMRSRT